MKLFDSRLDEYIMTAQTIMENLNFIAFYQKVKLMLLLRRRFQYVAKLIGQLNYAYNFRFDTNNASIIILNEISEIKYASRNGCYQIEMKTGLVEPEQYPLFEIKPFFAPQILANKQSEFLYVQPWKPNIILNKIGHHLLYEEKLLRRDTLGEMKICLMRQFSFTYESECESDLLLRPYVIN